MPVRIGAPRESSYEQPFKLLSDCHRRVEMFLGVLGQLARTEQSPLDQSSCDSLRRALDYFRDAAPRHTADEEESVFPRLQAIDGPEAAEARRIISQLESDHEEAAPRHEAIETIGRRWLVEGRLSPADRSQFKEHVEELERMYRRHIELEDSSLFPIAERLLAGNPAAEIGREMAIRRGISVGSTTSS